MSAVPPSDLDAEASVLSALILYPNRWLTDVRKELQPQHFYAEANRSVYEAICSLADDGSSIDEVTVLARLRAAGKTTVGSPYLSQLADATPAAAQISDHVTLIFDAFLKREAIAFGQQVAIEGANGVDTRPWLAKKAATLGELAASASKGTERRAQSPTDILAGWSGGGALVHEPTGIAALDELTGGGPVYGTRWVLNGGPDAGKTALLVQVGHTYAQRDIAVGLLAVDEEAGDIVTRLAQRVGYSRHHCEARDPAVIADMQRLLGALPIRFYDGAWTIETAAADLAAFASARGSRAMLGIDSIQTVRCAADLAAAGGGRELSEVTAVTARVHAVRAVASRHQLIAFATSEMGRGSYRSGDPTQQTSTMASGKWSGAIEYSARVLIGLRSVPEQTDLVELELAKNKHGPRDKKIYLRIDRASQTLLPVQYDGPEPTDDKARDASRAATISARTARDAAAVARVLRANPGQNVRKLYGSVRAETGLGNDRINGAISKLGVAVRHEPGPRGAQLLFLEETALPDDVRGALGDPQ